MSALYMPFKGSYRALMPSFPTKNQSAGFIVFTGFIRLTGFVGFRGFMGFGVSL